MRKSSLLVRLVLLAACLLTLACERGAVDDTDSEKVQKIKELIGSDMYGSESKEVQEIKELIEKELPLGATSEEVDRFLTKHGFVHSYDRFNNSYNAIVRDVPNHGILDRDVVIYINLDENGHYKSYEVYDSFTGP